MEPTPFNLILDTGTHHLGSSAEEYIRKRIEKLERWTRKFPSRSCHISWQVSERDGMHRFVISLKLPQLTLAGRAEEPSLTNAFDRALKRLLRQLNEFKHVMRREHLHREARAARMAQGPPDGSPAAGGAHERDVERFEAGLGDYAESLRSIIQSELDELRIRHGHVAAETDALVEAARRQAAERLADKPAGMDGRSWLYRMALEVVDAVAPRPVATPDAGAARSTSDTRTLDVVIDPEAAAEEAASMLATEQLHRAVEEKLAQLPRDWRRAFRMRYVDGLDPDEIGELLDLDRSQVTFRLRGASEFLRDHMEELRGTA